MESRQSRMNKYYDNNVDTVEETTGFSSRTQRNQELYREVSNLEIEDFDLNSNVSVLGDNTANINLEEIKDILSEKYRENPRKKSFGDTEEIVLPKINLDETREYDINSILEKAKEKKEVNYEEDRLKKIRSDQYDILKTLDKKNNEEEIEDEEIEEKPTDRRPAPNKEAEEAKLLDLINTITAKELIDNESNLEVNEDLDPLDLLSDLRGDDENTKVMGALVSDLVEEDKNIEITTKIDVVEEEKDELDEDTLGIETNEITESFDEENAPITQEELDKEIEKEEISKKNKKKEKKDKKLENSFIGTTTFKQSDFDDFDDLKDEGFGKILVKIIIVLVIIAFVAGCVVLLNNVLDLGLF